MNLDRRRRTIASALSLVLFAAACGQPNADAHNRKADAYLEASNPAEAIIELRVAVQAAPRRGDLRAKLADAYSRAGDMRNAVKEYVRAADLLPDDRAAQLKAGNMLLLAAAFEDAKGRAAKVLALDPKSAEGQVLLGNALAGLRDLDGAIAQYQEAMALNPALDSAYINLGAVQLVRGKRNEAEATFKKAIEAAPKSAGVRMALANFLWSSGRTAEAEQALKDALALEPGNLAANRALGTFYVASNRAAEAEPYFQAISRTANTTESILGLADYYVAVRRYDAAKPILTGLAAKAGAYAAATTRLAAIDALQGNRAQALMTLRDLLRKYPKEESAHLLDARLLVQNGQRDDALAEATTVVAESTNSPVAGDMYLLIGAIYATLDRTDDAINAYKAVLRTETRRLAADLALASLHLSAGSVDQAATYLEGARAIEPRHPAVRALAVRVLLAQNNLTKAREELSSLRTEFPNAPIVLNLVAAQQVADRQVDAARATYARAAELAPDDLEAVAGLVRIDLTRGRPKDALGRIETGLGRAQPTGDFLILAAQTYGAAGDSATAETLLKRAIDLDPARLQGYNLLGTLYLSQHRLDDARRQFQQIAERNPKSTSANTMLGMLLETQRRLPEAEAQYQKVLASDPRAAVAANNLAWLYVSSDRNLDTALQLAQRAQQQLPGEPHVNDTLGWIYYQKKLARAAIRHLETSVKNDANDPTTHYHLGMAYLQGGELEKARRELRRALAFAIGFDGESDARKTLAQIGS